MRGVGCKGGLGEGSNGEGAELVELELIVKLELWPEEPAELEELVELEEPAILVKITP